MRRVSGGTGWSFPVRVHLVFLVVGTLLPTLALTAVLTLRVIRDGREAVRRQLLEAARASATIVDSELLGTIRTLRALAESETLREELHVDVVRRAGNGAGAERHQVRLSARGLEPVDVATEGRGMPYSFETASVGSPING